MTTAIDPLVAYAIRGPRPGLKDRLRDWIPRLVLAPSFALVLIFVYGFNLWTVLISFTNSKAFANLNFIGWANYHQALELDVPGRSAVELVHGDRQHGPVRRPLCHLLPRART